MAAGVPDKRPTQAVGLTEEVRDIGGAVEALLALPVPNALGQIRNLSMTAMNWPSMSPRTGDSSVLGQATKRPNSPSLVGKAKMTRLRLTYTSRPLSGTSLQ